MAEDSKDLIGIVVGCVLPGAAPLAFYLHSRPGRRYHTHVDELTQFVTVHQALGSLARAFNACVVDVWRNRYHPVWYYIQLKRHASPNTLKCFGLPWATYFAWQKHLEVE